MGVATHSKSLIQFSVSGQGCVPSLQFTWGQTMVEVMNIMVTSFKRSHACTATLSAPNSAAGHHQPMPLLETPGHSRASLISLLWGHCSFLLGPGAHKVSLQFSRSVVSDSLRPHGLQPTRLLCPWDFPGKSTGVGCHCQLKLVIIKQHE